MPKHYPSVEEKREQLRKSIARSVEALGPKAHFIPAANNMAAGPCAGCLAINGKSYPASKVPLMPLDVCPHPDQCAGHLRTDTSKLFG